MITHYPGSGVSRGHIECARLSIGQIEDYLLIALSREVGTDVEPATDPW